MAHRLYFAKLLKWDLLIDVCYKIVRFLAVMSFIPYGHKPHKFITKFVSADILVAWQSTVYEPPVDGINKGPKHIGASVKYLTL
jgi:hypothetical protein